MNEEAQLAAMRPVYENWSGIDRELTEAVGKVITARIPSGGLGLELGWGSGAMHGSLLERLEVLHVIEGDPGIAERARNVMMQTPKTRLGDFVFECLFDDFTSAPWYHDIIMSEVLEHVRNPRRLLRKAMSWLRFSGRIHVVVPNANSIHRLLATVAGMMPSPVALGETDIRNGHRRSYTWDSIKWEVERAGLEVTHMEGILLKPFPGPGMNLLSETERRRLFELSPCCPELCAEVYVECRRPESC